MTHSFQITPRWLFSVCTGFLLCSLVSCAPPAPPCKNDGECPNATPRCISGVCRECKGAEDCASQKCLSNGACASVEPATSEVSPDVSHEPALEPVSSNDADAAEITVEPVAEVVPEPQPEPVPEAVCTNGTTRPCYPAGKNGCSADSGGKFVCKGICAVGTESCVDGVWSGKCVGTTEPSAELCNGKDDDCDGVIDNGFANLGQSCDVGKGECKTTGKYVCKADGTGTECDAKPGTPTNEICDKKDNNCDGSVDEGCPCVLGDTQPCGSDKGECKKGTQTCDINGKWGICSGEVKPATEVCNGKDDDCDGVIDNGFANLNQPCDVGQGECKTTGKYVCQADGKGTMCDAKPGQASTEVCDGKDNDCNGKIDDIAEFGQTCADSSRKGECQAGVWECVNNQKVCKQAIQASTEKCNGKDDDCDGQIDNRCGFFWAVSSDGTGSMSVYSITTDSADNLYITGSYQGTVVFGNTTLSSQGGSDDVFIAKLSNQGAFLWSVSVGGIHGDYVFSTATDSIGNLYITGSYQGTAVFGNTTLSSLGGSDVFVAKLSNQGAFLWSVSAGGLSISGARSITIDSTENLYITGYYHGTVVFGSATLFSQGNADVFVAKLSNQGVFLWAVSAGGTNDDLANSTSVDSAGNLYITGYYSGTAVFGSTTLSSLGGSIDVFIAKLSNQGALLWAASAGGTGTDYGNSITADSAGNLYFTGVYSGTTVFGSTTLSSQGSVGTFVAKLSNQGVFLWVVSAGGAARSIAMDSTVNLYVTGSYSGTAVFGSTTLSSQGGSGVFVAKLR